MRTNGSWFCSIALTLGLSAAAVTSAQDQIPVLDQTEKVDFDRTEAWAMQFFGSVAMFTPLCAPVVREPGSVDVAVEVTQVPHLSADQRRVGFDGVKEEDLNRLPVFVRPRVTVGLPHRFAIEVGWVPPIEIDGVQPNIFSLALDRVLYVGQNWSFGARLHGQIGSVEGDLVCSEEDASFAPGTPENSYGCQAPSNDETTLDHVALHLGAGYQVKSARGPTFLFGAGAIHHDLEFQVDAFTYSVHDRTRLLADGTTWALDAGMSIPASDRTQLGIELLWSPLEVVRPPETTPQNDDLFHVKALVRYRVR